MRKRVVSAIVASLALASHVYAQQHEKWVVGAGYSANSLGGLSGGGFYGHAGYEAPGVWILDKVRIAASGGTANADGSPLSCEQAQQIYCFGRRDENVWGELDVMADAVAIEGDSFDMYALTGPGLFFRRTRSNEAQGPATFCIIDGQVVSCPDNPPFQGFSKTDRVWGAAWTFGWGFRGIGSLKWFVEMRAHMIWEGGDERSALLPITVGIRF